MGRCALIAQIGDGNRWAGSQPEAVVDDKSAVPNQTEIRESVDALARTSGTGLDGSWPRCAKALTTWTRGVLTTRRHEVFGRVDGGEDQITWSTR